MANETLAELFHHFAFLLELKAENPFKIKAFQNTARLIEEQPKDAAELVASGEITKIPGIGKGSQSLITEYVKSGTIEEFAKLQKEFPATICELLTVRGLGPKKAKALFESLEIGSLSELEYACQENRLLELKGFGAKTQENILKSIHEIKSHQGKILLPMAIAEAEAIKESLLAVVDIDDAILVGELRRSLEIISAYEFLLVPKTGKTLDLSSLPKLSEKGLPIQLHLFDAKKESLGEAIFRHTGNKEFVESVPHDPKKNNGKTEYEFFASIHLPWIPPEARECVAGKCGKRLVEEKDIRGVFHLHTTASDGANSLEEMALAAIDLGFEYLGVSDHSQTAVYANGLKEPNIKQQRGEIDRLREKYPQLRIYHGIESDILSDGSLDYSDKVLEQFDFVIASVHSGFKMPRAEMTRRICRALENPHTTWLGHMTGRLLLGRTGYELDIEEVLKTAEKFGKSIELNSHPYRLDIDWRWLPEARARKIPIGIFPDAHSAHGLQDFRYGVLMARKGGLGPEDVSNTKSLKEMDEWLLKN